MEVLKLSRDDLLNVLNEMNVVIPRDTKLKVDRIRHRLERALDAAQRYSTLFGNEIIALKPLDYPVWDDKKDVSEGLYRKVWGGISREGERVRGTFAKICMLIVALGEEWKKDVHNVVFTDERSTAIVVHVSSNYILQSFIKPSCLPRSCPSRLFKKSVLCSYSATPTSPAQRKRA